MYLPRHFEESDRAALHGLVRAHPFATWITLADDGLRVNHLPMLLDAERGPNGTLVGHVARANPVWRDFSASVPSVFVFQGPDAYVSPSWYATKRVSAEVVPTWNYAVVHAHGRPRAVEDRAWLRDVVGRLTDAHEAGEAHPWRLEDAPAPYVERMLGAIVGIEVPIDRLVGKWKVSQNRPEADRRGVAAGLSGREDAASQALAGMMRARDP